MSSKQSRFCYSYKPQGPIDNCCNSVICASNEHLALKSSLPAVTSNSCNTTESSLLLSVQQQYLKNNNENQISSIVQSTIANTDNITNSIYSQLLQIKQQRYEPYQPYIYPVVPQSVVQLQMNTINTGVPHSFFTAGDCKGVQYVTSSNDDINII